MTLLEQVEELIKMAKDFKAWGKPELEISCALHAAKLIQLIKLLEVK